MRLRRGLLTEFAQRDQRSVDGECQFHGQFRRDDRGQDEHDVQQQLALVHVLFPTLDPDVRAGGDGKDQEEPDKDERLEVVGRHAFVGKDHGADELTLGGSESGLEDDGETSTIRG